MKTSARIIADSQFQDSRLTTFEVTFHRFVLAEFNTHRVFSRNSASSRAIPVEKQLMRALESPAFPLVMPAEQPGMQGGAELTGKPLADAERLLVDIWKSTTGLISEYIEDHPDKSTRLHKGHLNRPMEWFMWHTVIVTSTEYENFFAQRCHKDAQPEIRHLAEIMRDAYRESVPREFGNLEIHSPYIQPDELGDPRLSSEDIAKLSAARCARVSYLTHDGNRDWEKDFDLFDKLTAQNPGHWSPLEHVAIAALPGGHSAASSGNFNHNWMQLRYIYENEMNLNQFFQS